MVHQNRQLRSVVLLAILILVIAISSRSQNRNEGGRSIRKPEVKTAISYCDLKLSEGWKLGNLSFNSLYSIRVNRDGKVTEIKRVRDDFIGEKEVKLCVSAWEIRGFPDGSLFSVYFVWKHGKGWIRQEISGSGFSQVMAMPNVGIE